MAKGMGMMCPVQEAAMVCGEGIETRAEVFGMNVRNQHIFNFK